MNQVDALVMQHQDYVRSLARGIARKLPRHVDFEELVAMGQVGLLSAARQFDPTRGVAFTTFAYYRIRGAILDGLRQMAWLPPSLRRELTRMQGENEIGEAAATSGENSQDPEFLARQFSTAVGRLGAVFLLSQTTDAEDQPLEPADDTSTADRVEQREQVQRLRQAMERLSPEHRQLIHALYFEQRSMTDLANELKKNKSTISRRHTDALDALRAALGG